MIDKCHQNSCKNSPFAPCIDGFLLFLSRSKPELSILYQHLGKRHDKDGDLNIDFKTNHIKSVVFDKRSKRLDFN